MMRARSLTQNLHLVFAAAAIAATTAGEVVSSKPSAKKSDTIVASAVVPESARGALPTDSTTSSAPVATDNATQAAARSDTGDVQIYPPQPRRGGVLFALAQGST